MIVFFFLNLTVKVVSRSCTKKLKQKYSMFMISKKIITLVPKLHTSLPVMPVTNSKSAPMSVSVPGTFDLAPVAPFSTMILCLSVLTVFLFSFLINLLWTCPPLFNVSLWLCHVSYPCVPTVRAFVMRNVFLLCHVMCFVSLPRASRHVLCLPTMCLMSAQG